MDLKQHENNCINDEFLINNFLNNLLSFMDESGEDESIGSSGCNNSDILSTARLVTSGNFESFSTSFVEDLVYQKCNFSNNVTPTWSNSAFGLRSSVKFNEDLSFTSSNQMPTLGLTTTNGHAKKRRPGICQFCFKNGEPKIVYSGHILKSLDGLVVCPTLRRYVCSLCGATGSYSHTRKYCPKYMEMMAWQEFFYQNYVF